MKFVFKVFKILSFLIFLITGSSSSAQETLTFHTTFDQYIYSYKDFLKEVKSHLDSVDYAKDRLASGKYGKWKELPENPSFSSFKPGDRFYYINHDRSLIAIVIGKKTLQEGIKAAATHIDSPFLLLKPNPVTSSPNGMVLLKTLIHGDIKPYQWLNIPLELRGELYFPSLDGQDHKIRIKIGDTDQAPKLMISDLASNIEKGIENLKKEHLNPIAGVLSTTSYPATQPIMAILKSAIANAGHQVSDEALNLALKSAELSVVPAHPPLDVGWEESKGKLDSPFIAAYGQDAKGCVFGLVQAYFDFLAFSVTPEYTTVLMLLGNEEISSWNTYGIESAALHHIFQKVVQGCSSKKEYRENMVDTMLSKSLFLVADAIPAMDPVRNDFDDVQNTSKLGSGTVFLRNGLSAGMPEQTSKIMTLLANHRIPFQTYTFNQDKVAGGSTFSKRLATRLNVPVVDIGIPILSMHAPYEITSKQDNYTFYQALYTYFTAIF